MDHYFLQSPRLGFRHWSRADLPLAQALWGNPEVTRFIGGPFSPEKIQERLNTEIDLCSRHNVQYWPIFLLESHEHAGCAGLRPYRPENSIFELGVHLPSPQLGLRPRRRCGPRRHKFRLRTRRCESPLRRPSSGQLRVATPHPETRFPPHPRRILSANGPQPSVIPSSNPRHAPERHSAASARESARTRSSRSVSLETSFVATVWNFNPSPCAGCACATTPSRLICPSCTRK